MIRTHMDRQGESATDSVAPRDAGLLILSRRDI